MKEFWTKHKTKIMIVGGVVLAIAIGVFAFRKRK